MPGRGKRRGDETAGGPPSDEGGSLATLHARPRDLLHVLTEQHLALFDSAARIRPELGALLDLRRFEPGSESIESASCRVHGWLRARGFDKPLFLVLCEVNAGRLLAAIARELDLGGWPFDEHDVLGELLGLLQRHYFVTTRPERPDGFDAIGRGTSFFAALLAAARDVIEQRVRLLIAESVPLPGTRAPGLAAAPGLVAEATQRLAHHRHRLRASDLRQWIAYAMVATLSPDDRRLIQLRARRDRTLQEIATQMECTAFEAGRRLRLATDALFTEVDRILELFNSEPAAARVATAQASAGGRLLELPLAALRRSQAPKRAPKLAPKQSETVTPPFEAGDEDDDD